MAPDAMDSSANNRPSLPSDQSQFGYQVNNFSIKNNCYSHVDYIN